MVFPLFTLLPKLKSWRWYIYVCVCVCVMNKTHKFTQKKHIKVSSKMEKNGTYSSKMQFMANQECITIRNAVIINDYSNA
jgi:hypothetical protein